MLEHYLDSPKLLMIVLSIWLLAVAITFPVMDSPSLGFSAINMGLLAFSIGLFRHHKEFAKSLAGWLGLNIVIGLLPQISFWGHLGGAVSGMVVFVSLWWFGWREVR